MLVLLESKILIVYVPVVARLRAVMLAPLAPLALVMLYHQACFGGPFRPPYGFRASNALHVRGVEGIRGPRLGRGLAKRTRPGSVDGHRGRQRRVS